LFQSQNTFLAALSASDKSRIQPHLKPLQLILGDHLQEQGALLAHVYFPETGLISLLATMKDGRAVESAMVGRTGGVGLAAGSGSLRHTSLAIVQAPGSAFRIAAKQFLKIARESATLQEMLLGQVQQIAACNALHSAEQRLASWLLQAQDHAAGAATLPFTQEFLAHMLGVRRTTVTEIAMILQKRGTIEYARGRITIASRRLLEKAACECYGVICGLAGRAKRAAA
jgi:CRP-like cAMP-binding protein